MSTHNIGFYATLESPRRGDSNEHPQHRFLCKNDENNLSIIIKICTLSLLLMIMISYTAPKTHLPCHVS